jgi:hypothetical protein
MEYHIPVFVPVAFDPTAKPKRIPTKPPARKYHKSAFSALGRSPNSQPRWATKAEIEKVYIGRDALNAKFGLAGSRQLVVDHIIPLNPMDKSVCGLHCPANLQLLSWYDNHIKCDHYETDW